jgi:16S rRNA (cytosine967-C5)-methyltransferase
MIKRWSEAIGKDNTVKMCEYLNRPPEYDLRINFSKISKAGFLHELKETGIAVESSAYFDGFVRISEMQSLLKGRWINDGICTVQDESASIPVDLLDLNDNDSVLDVCSAPGGKLTQIFEKNIKNLKIFSMDVSYKRILILMESIKKYPDMKIFNFVADGRNLPIKTKFEKILIDAPCSGLGVIRKHPDIKWRREFNDLVKFSETQFSILSETAKYLKKGGRLVYSTCTIDSLENENIINRFLQTNPGFTALHPPQKFDKFADQDSIKVIPGVHDMDGSFAVILQN